MNKDEFLKSDDEEDEIEIEDPLEIYTVEVTCQNCGFSRYYHNIPKGTPFKVFLKDELCLNCKCKIIEDEKRRN